MKAHHLHSDLKMVFGRDLRQERREKVVERILEVLIHERDEHRLRRIVELFGWLNAHLKQQPTQENMDAEDFFADTVVAPLLVRVGYGEFFDAVWTTTFDPGNRSEQDLVALRRFEMSVHRVMGEDIQLSITFALDLLERFARCKANQFGFSVFDKNAQISARTKEERDMFVASMALRDGVLAPVSRVTPTKGWMLCLLEQIETNKVAAEVWRDVDALLGVQCFPGGKLRLFNLDDPKTAQHVQEQYLSGNALRSSVGDIRNMYFALPGVHYRIYKRWCEVLRVKRDVVWARCVRHLEWLRANEQVLDSRVEAMLQDISLRPRRGLRPGGFDHVDVRVSLLQATGVRGVVFHPEAHTLPDTGLEVLTRKATPHLYSYHVSLAAFDELHPIAVEGICEEDNSLLLRKLLRYVLVDVLHRIIVGDRPLREKSQEIRGSESPGPSYPVRPHVRRLPKGFQATAEARQRGKETFGYDLPDGITFVRAGYSHGRMTYDLPTTAFAEYGDEDLLDLVKPA